MISSQTQLMMMNGECKLTYDHRHYRAVRACNETLHTNYVRRFLSEATKLENETRRVFIKTTRFAEEES